MSWEVRQKKNVNCWPNDGIREEIPYNGKFNAEYEKEPDVKCSRNDLIQILEQLLSFHSFYKFGVHTPGTKEELFEAAETMATEIAENSPLAVQASKDVLNYGIGKSIDDGLKYVASVSTNIIPSEDLFEAVKAFMEKRKPEFTGK